MMGVAFSCRDTWCKERKFPSTQTTVSTLGLASWQDYVLGCDCPSSKVRLSQCTCKSGRARTHTHTVAHTGTGTHTHHRHTHTP